MPAPEQRVHQDTVSPAHSLSTDDLEALGRGLDVLEMVVAELSVDADDSGQLVTGHW